MFSSKRLMFRKLNMDDVEALTKIVRDEKIMKNISNGKIWSINRINKFIQWNMNDKNDPYFGIFIRAKLIGIIGMYDTNNIRIFINKSGKGYGSESVSAYIKHMNLDEVYARIDDDNIVSRHMFEKLGFTYIKNDGDVAVYRYVKEYAE